MKRTVLYDSHDRFFRLRHIAVSLPQLSQSQLEGLDHGRDRLDQGDDAACGNGTGTDIPHVSDSRSHPADISLISLTVSGKTGALRPLPHQLISGMITKAESAPPATITVAMRIPRM